MDTFLIIGLLAIMALALVLFFELRATQTRLDAVRGDVDQQLRQRLQAVAEPMSHIPDIEQRLRAVETELADNRQEPGVPAEPATPASSGPAPPV